MITATRENKQANRELSLAIHSRSSAQRQVSERLVQDVFADAYGAKVYSFLDQILYLYEGTEACGTIAYSPAKEHFWLEDYLELPVEQQALKNHGLDISRHHIAEVGNLASNNCHGYGKALIFSMTEFLLSSGYKWAVFTSTKHLRVFFKRQRVQFHSLGHAKLDLLSDCISDWGSYYEHCPEVILLNLEELKASFSKDSQKDDFAKLLISAQYLALNNMETQL